MSDILVLLRYRKSQLGDDENGAETVEVDSIHNHKASLLERLNQLEDRNKPYKMKQVMDGLWEIGPPPDGSIFTPRKMVFRMVSPKQKWVLG